MKLYYFKDHEGLAYQSTFCNMYLTKEERNQAMEDARLIDSDDTSYEHGSIELDELLEKSKKWAGVFRHLLFQQLKRMGINVQEAA